MKMEKIQERALRFVYKDYSSSLAELLKKAKLPALHVRRMRTMALETYKIYHNLAPPVLSNLVVKKENHYNFRYSNLLQIPQFSTVTYGKNSFKFAAPMMWNSLPEEFRVCSSFSQFKGLISNWNGLDCKCLACRPG